VSPAAHLLASRADTVQQFTFSCEARAAWIARSCWPALPVSCVVLQNNAIFATDVDFLAAYHSLVGLLCTAACTSEQAVKPHTCISTCHAHGCMLAATPSVILWQIHEFETACTCRLCCSILGGAISAHHQQFLEPHNSCAAVMSPSAQHQPSPCGDHSPIYWSGAVHTYGTSAIKRQVASPLTHVLLTGHRCAGPAAASGHFCMQMPEPCSIS
jgi:hypothetical protein